LAAWNDRPSPCARILHGLLALALSVLIAGCAARPGPELLQPTAAAPGSRLVDVLVATTRGRVAPGVNVFTNDRSQTVNYASFTVAVPPGHQPGQVELSATRDPSRSFTTVAQSVLTQQTFDRRAIPPGPAGQDVGVFVHGFNNNFQEALFRLAQIAADANLRQAPILFAWPSQGSVLGYLADRDAVTFSRDHLARLLISLTTNRRVGRVRVVAHSMGAWLLVETLRQLKIAGRNDVLNRLNVLLAAPDIDIDVFLQQVSVIGALQRPMTILVSSDDRALAVSARLSGARERIGRLDVSDPRVQEAALKARIQIVDISKLTPSDRLGHDRYTALAALYPRLNSTQMAGDGLHRAGAFVLDTAGAIVAAPFSLIGRAQAGQ